MCGVKLGDAQFERAAEWEKDRGWFTTTPFGEPEVFDSPECIGPVECVKDAHEEALLIPRQADAKRVTFTYGLDDEFIETLKTLHKLGLDRTGKVTLADGPGPPALRRGRLPACPTRLRSAAASTARRASAPG